jgi:DNA-binding transcriptional LysR family regulator
MPVCDIKSWALRSNSRDPEVNLQHLKTFIRIAELGSLSKASDRMRIAQPALSRQMKLLQEEIGIPLFERHRRGMRVTQAGEDLLQRVSGLIRQLDQVYADVRSSSGATSGHVAFGIVPTVSDVLAARLVGRVAADFPGISLRIVEGYAGHLLEWLQKGEIDVAIMYGPQANLHIKSYELVTEDLVLVGPSDGDIGPANPVSVAAFARMPLVLPSRPHGLRVLLEGAALKAKTKLDVRFEADSFRVLKDLVEKGLGYTALPLSAVALEVKQGRLRYAPLAQPKVTRELILGIPDGLVSHATRKTIDLARQEIATLVRSGDWQAKLQFTPGRPWR